MTYADNTRRSVPDLVGSVFRQLAELMRTEGMLARAEMSEKITHIGNGVGLLVAGAILAMPALVVLLEAAVAALVESGMAPYWAAYLVGGLCLLLGIIFLLVGTNRLRARNLVPGKTLQQLQYDADAARNQVRTSHVEKRAA
jgi:membrane protein implicated in regulation of membrane protease activity